MQAPKSESGDPQGRDGDEDEEAADKLDLEAINFESAKQDANARKMLDDLEKGLEESLKPDLKDAESIPGLPVGVPEQLRKLRTQGLKAVDDPAEPSSGAAEDPMEDVIAAGIPQGGLLRALMKGGQSAARATMRHSGRPATPAGLARSARTAGRSCSRRARRTSLSEAVAPSTDVALRGGARRCRWDRIAAAWSR